MRIHFITASFAVHIAVKKSSGVSEMSKRNFSPLSITFSAKASDGMRSVSTSMPTGLSATATAMASLQCEMEKWMFDTSFSMGFPCSL